MTTYKIPPNVGRVRVVMGLGGTYTVWNGKQGRGEFAIPCRKREEAERIAKLINTKQHDGTITV